MANKLKIFLFGLAMVILLTSFIAANSAMGCIGCVQKGVLDNKCDISGKHFDKGVYDWSITSNGTILFSGRKVVDATKKFCINLDIPECIDYDINFGYAYRYHENNCEVPVVPEFGTIIGVVTLFSAMGVFFIIRRR